MPCFKTARGCRSAVITACGSAVPCAALSRTATDPRLLITEACLLEPNGAQGGQLCCPGDERPFIASQTPLIARTEGARLALRIVGALAQDHSDSTKGRCAMFIHQSSGSAGRCRGLRGLALTGVLLALAALAFGQAETGAITGTITDPSGAVVPNATVKATSVATQAKRTATTNSNGLYTLSALPPGQYDLSVSATNFAPFTRRVNVSVGSRNEISMQVNLASTSTTVEVVAGGGGTQVETQSSELSQVVNSQQVA